MKAAVFSYHTPAKGGGLMSWIASKAINPHRSLCVN
jgi:hypothetical protein